jgi:ribosomal protein S15P/S13E
MASISISKVFVNELMQLKRKRKQKFKSQLKMLILYLKGIQLNEYETYHTRYGIWDHWEKCIIIDIGMNPEKIDSHVRCSNLFFLVEIQSKFLLSIFLEHIWRLTDYLQTESAFKELIFILKSPMKQVHPHVSFMT